MKYPSNRPHIYVLHNKRPAKDAKGKLIKDKIESVETFYVTDNHNQNLFDQASVVIDLFPQLCVKNRFPDQHDKWLIHHYVQKYVERLNAALTVYLSREWDEFDRQNIDQAISAIRVLQSTPKDIE